MQIQKKISKKEIIESKLSHLELYSYYMPWKFELNKRCLNPYITETNPSFVIYYRDGKYFHKAFNTNHKGDVWQFLMDLSQKTFEEVLDGVISDFGLLEVSTKKLERIIQELPKIEKKEHKMPKIVAEVYKNWQQRHLDYLAQYYLEPKDLDFCKDTKCYPLKNFYLNYEKFNVSPKEVAFVYNVGQSNKVYLPSRSKDQKWWSNIPFTYIHGLDNLKGCNIGIISKSIKDGAVLSKYITPCISIIQAENPLAISKKNIEIIKQSCQKIIICMDSDKKGKETSYKLCELFGATHANIPDRLLELGASDWADWIKLEGKEPIIEHFKKKGII